MKYLYEFYETYFGMENKLFAELLSFYKIDKDCKRIDVTAIEFSGKKDAEKIWTEFWKLFLCNLKLLMMYHEKKEENELTRLFPIKTG